LAPPAGGNPVTAGPEDCVAEGISAAAGVVAKALGALGAGVVAEAMGAGAVGDGAGWCMLGLGAGVAGGGVGWWCLHPHVRVGSGVVAGGVVDGRVLVQWHLLTVCWLTWAGDTVAA